MSSLFCWWSLCCFPKGIHPPTHLSIQLSTHPSNYPTIHQPTY